MSCAQLRHRPVSVSLLYYAMPIISYWIEKCISYKSYHSLLSLQMHESVSSVKTTNKRTSPIVPRYILPYSDRLVNLYGRWNGTHDKRGNQVKLNIHKCVVDEGDTFPLENILKQLIPVWMGTILQILERHWHNLILFFNRISSWSNCKRKNSETRKQN